MPGSSSRRVRASAGSRRVRRGADAADHQPAPEARADPLRLLAGGVDGRQDRPDPGRGRPRPRAVRSTRRVVRRSRRDPELVLELADLLRQRRLGHVQPGRRPGRSVAPRRRPEVAQVTELHASNSQSLGRREMDTSGYRPSSPTVDAMTDIVICEPVRTPVGRLRRRARLAERRRPRLHHPRRAGAAYRPRRGRRRRRRPRQLLPERREPGHRPDRRPRRRARHRRPRPPDRPALRLRPAGGAVRRRAGRHRRRRRSSSPAASSRCPTSSTTRSGCAPASAAAASS